MKRTFLTNLVTWCTTKWSREARTRVKSRGCTSRNMRWFVRWPGSDHGDLLHQNVERRLTMRETQAQGLLRRSKVFYENRNAVLSSLIARKPRAEAMSDVYARSEALDGAGRAGTKNRVGLVGRRCCEKSGTLTDARSCCT